MTCRAHGEAIRAENRRTLSGLAAVLIAGAVAFGMEKTGIPRAAEEIQKAKIENIYVNIPEAKNFYTAYEPLAVRVLWDCIPAVLAGIGTYNLFKKKSKGGC
jgi:hypothetical protein